MSKKDDLKPFTFHGMFLGDTSSGQITVECPFCKRKKLFINTETSQWYCQVCKAGVDGKSGGNSSTFLKVLHNISFERTEDKDYEPLMEDRGYKLVSTLRAWGVAKSVFSNRNKTIWLLPAYHTDGKFRTLYKHSEGTPWIASPGHGVGLFGMDLYKSTVGVNYWCEGAWDGMALYESMNRLKRVGERYARTAGSENLYKDVNIIAIPGSGLWYDDWSGLADRKENIILGDNDYPKTDPNGNLLKQNGGYILPGYNGMKRLAGKIHATSKKTYYLNWGRDGYSPNYSDGHDVRDLLCKGDKAIEDRYKEFAAKIEEVPESWSNGLPKEAISTNAVPQECKSYEELIAAWKKAQTWFEGLDHAFTCMLASVVSVSLPGDQIWMRIIGPPSCGKTTLVESLAVDEQNVYSLSVFRGFHSGYNSGEGKDSSLMPLVKDKTFIVKDGDTLLQAPNRAQILAEARDVYDGTSRAHYRNNVQNEYKNHRMSWLLCGTPAIRAIDSSDLGERFLDVVIMEEIDDDLEDRVMVDKARAVGRSISNTSRRGNMLDSNLEKAYKLTGGYVAYLRKNADSLLENIELTDDVFNRIARCAKFVAFMRSKSRHDKLDKQSREHGARLTSQLTKLALCLAAAMKKKEVDEDVLGRIRKVALNTSIGPNLEIAKFLYARENGATENAIKIHMHSYNAKRKDGVVDQVGHLTGLKFGTTTFIVQKEGDGRTKVYCLSPRARKLFEDVYGKQER